MQKFIPHDQSITCPPSSGKMGAMDRDTDTAMKLITSASAPLDSGNTMPCASSWPSFCAVLMYFQLGLVQTYMDIHDGVIGASVSEPHTCQTASPAIYDLSIYHTSIHK